MSRPLIAQVVLVDEQFNGASVDTSVFTFSGAGPESFFGRTQLNSPELPGPFDAPPVENGVLRLRAMSFNPFGSSAGNLFLADEIRTIQQFAPTDNTTIVAETRARFVDDATNPLAGGLIGGIFFFGLDPNFPNPLERDEIDFELLSNFPQDVISTNIFNDQGFSSPGDFVVQTVAGLDLTEFNDFRIETAVDSTRFFVNDVLIREQTSGLAIEPQDFRLNINVQDFPPAGNADLQPTANPALNETFIFEVDSLVITEVPIVQPSGNLLTNPSFEVGGGSLAGWTVFNDLGANIEVTSEPAQDGNPLDGPNSLRFTGQFNGGFNFQGAFQNVPVEGGDRISASVSTLVRSLDSIAGTDVQAELSIEYFNVADGQFGTDDFISQVVLLAADGTTTEDEFMLGVIDDIVPDGAVEARFVLTLLQFDSNDTGAVHFDLASFLIVGDGDFSADGVVDAADYQAWVDAFGQAVAEPGLGADGNRDGIVNAADFVVFRDNLVSVGAATDLAVRSAPEPATLAMGGVALLAGLTNRRQRPLSS